MENTDSYESKKKNDDMQKRNTESTRTMLLPFNYPEALVKR